MAGKVTFKGAALTLVGRRLKTESYAPDFKVSAPDLKDVVLSDFKGKIKVITSFPSLDTPVCDLQVKEFNKHASGISAEVVVVGISKDLPFAQKRFCETFEIKNVRVLSDYKTSQFGVNYGLLIKELNLLARAVLIVDKNDVLRYIQIVEEVTNPPDYGAVLKALEYVLATPALTINADLPGKCLPCEGGALALTEDKVSGLKANLPNWELIPGRKLHKEFKFKDFSEAKYFLDLVSIVSETQDHHPGITLDYNKVKITLTTYAAGGLTKNDFILAHMIDELQV